MENNFARNNFIKKVNTLNTVQLNMSQQLQQLQNNVLLQLSEQVSRSTEDIQQMNYSSIAAKNELVNKIDELRVNQTGDIATIQQKIYSLNSSSKVISDNLEVVRTNITENIELLEQSLLNMSSTVANILAISESKCKSQQNVKKACITI